MVVFGGDIPTHIHQIWIGPNAVPELWVNTIREFSKKEGIEYTFWNETSIQEQLKWGDFPGLKELFNSHDHLAAKCDIARYLILYQYGGLYIDADCVIINEGRLKEFLQNENKAGAFFAWEEFTPGDKGAIAQLPNANINIKTIDKMIANSIIGSKLAHPFIKLLLDSIQDYNKEHTGKAIWRTTGPAYVMNMWKANGDKYNDLKIYPMTYFYPVTWKGLNDPYAHTKMTFPPESMFFQYGYSTNGFADILNKISSPKKGGRRVRRKTKRNRKTRKRRLY